MELYDEKCPICGKLNKNLYLKETEGRFICEHCKSDVQLFQYMQQQKVPLLTPQQMAASVKR